MRSVLPESNARIRIWRCTVRRQHFTTDNAMTSKFAFLYCAPLLLLLQVSNASCATAAPASPAAAPASPFSASTVNDFLAACRGDQGGCQDEVGNALLDKMKYDGSTTICLPSAEYAQAVPAWLDSHPETHQMPLEDGIFLALKSLYVCH